MLVTFTVLFSPAVAFSNVNVPVAVGTSLFAAPVNTTFPVVATVPLYCLLFAVADTIKVRLENVTSFVTTYSS